MKKQHRDIRYIPYEVYSEIDSGDRGQETGMVDHGEKKTWGWSGAGFVIVTRNLDRVLLLRRASNVSDSDLWGIPGGARKELEEGPDRSFIDPRNEIEEYLEDPLVAAVEESREEIGGLPRGRIREEPYTYRESGTEFRYDKFVLEVKRDELRRFEPDLNWEHDYYSWVRMDSLDSLGRIHPGVKEFFADYDL